MTKELKNRVLENKVLTHDERMEIIKALEQQTSDCKIFGTKENCFGGATEYECNHCDYKQALEQESYEDEVQKVVDYLLSPKSKSSSEDCVSREQALLALTGTNLGEKSADELIALFDKRMKALPPVTPTRRWIPVSESLPKENELYQCTVILNDLPRTMELFYKNGKWLDNRRINMFDTYDIYGYGNTKEKHKLSYQELISEFEWNQVIIAWQPLPRPYEEKRGGEND